MLETTSTHTATASTHGILKPSAARANFSLQRELPAPDLAEFIERHWIVRWDLIGHPPFAQELLPHPCVNLAFEGDRATGGVHGIPRRRASRTIEGRGWVVGTKFRPGGFAPFTAIAMPALLDRAVSLEEAFGRSAAAQLSRDVAAQGDAAGRIGAVESFLRERRPPPDPRRELVTAIVAEMLSSDPGIRVVELAERHGLSPRGLQRMFRRYVGVSPKWVLRRYRLHEAAERIAAGETSDYAELAYELGYSDQSHFNRDFRAMVGGSPSAYARACASAE